MLAAELHRIGDAEAGKEQDAERKVGHGAERVPRLVGHDILDLPHGAATLQRLDIVDSFRRIGIDDAALFGEGEERLDGLEPVVGGVPLAGGPFVAPGDDGRLVDATQLQGALLFDQLAIGRVAPPPRDLIEAAPVQAFLIGGHHPGDTARHAGRAPARLRYRIAPEHGLIGRLEFGRAVIGQADALALAHAIVADAGTVAVEFAGDVGGQPRAHERIRGR